MFSSVAQREKIFGNYDMHTLIKYTFISLYVSSSSQYPAHEMFSSKYIF
jgi:hypothetical protein